MRIWHNASRNNIFVVDERKDHVYGEQRQSDDFIDLRVCRNSGIVHVGLKKEKIGE